MDMLKNTNVRANPPVDTMPGDMPSKGKTPQFSLHVLDLLYQYFFPILNRWFEFSPLLWISFMVFVSEAVTLASSFLMCLIGWGMIPSFRILIVGFVDCFCASSLCVIFMYVVVRKINELEKRLSDSKHETELKLQDAEHERVMQQKESDLALEFKLKEAELEYDRIIREAYYEAEIKLREEEKKAYEKNYEATRYLAGTISHDLNNYLLFFEGILELAKPLMSQDSRIVKRLPALAAKLQHCRSHVSGMQDFCSVITLKKSSVDVEDLLDYTLLAGLDRFKGIEVERNYKAEGAIIQADSSLIDSVFENLIKNAVEAMNGTGKLIINTQIAKDGVGSYLVVNIEDTGGGISSDILPYLFQPSISTKRESGHGYGLSKAYRTVKAHGGNITVESIPGVGTKFTVYLPIDQPDSQ